MHWWMDYCKGRDSQINGKVTPGNNAGGITNVLEKALGCAKKGGSSPLNDVVGYAEPVTGPGLIIMNSPSYDPVSAAAMFAGGCNLCAFTTGRGSCYGSQMARPRAGLAEEPEKESEPPHSRPILR